MSGIALDLPALEGRSTAAVMENPMQTFNVSGMTCGHCARAVTEAVHRVDPTALVEVDLKAGRAIIRDGKAPASRVRDAIAAEGYPTEQAA